MPYVIAATAGAVMAAALFTLLSVPGLLGFSLVQTFGTMLTLVLILLGVVLAGVLHAVSGLGRMI